MSQAREFISRQEAKAPFFVGLDLGGTNIKAGVVDDLGRALTWLTAPTLVERGPEDGARRMGEAVLEAIGRAGLQPSDVAAVGLGSPGFADIPAGKLLEPANLKGWWYFPLRDRVAAHCGLPVVFANDATAAAYGELWVGSGRGLHSMVLVTLGTGIGSGIIIGDMLIDGHHSLGAEFGHSLIDCNENARLCGCGQRGHVEAYCSATAVNLRAQEVLHTSRPTSVAARVREGAELSPKLLAEEAAKGDQLSMEIILETARYLGIGLVNLMQILDPEGILLGGAMTFGGHESPVGRRFLERVKQEVGQRAFSVLAEKTHIDFATLGGDAGFLGAAGIARLEVGKKGARG